ncbi:DUF4062 domain-containing protein [Cupriavidus basilensis]|uniref:DUF4062 domain-containing protein n=1 Tax=Cupriavidus basilensis TaxID=68895 RepID=UPI0039F6F551
MKFFLSSTAYDLYDFRALVVDELQKLGHEVLHHEMPTFSSSEPLHSHDACLKAVESCQAVICLLDRRYGGTYHGAAKQPYVEEVEFSVKTGDKQRHDIKIGPKELSITWCELLAARHFKKPMLTFARKRLMDEKETRRKNQLLTDFQPAYADDNKLFDLIDWLTKQKTFNWISPFDSVVDFRQKLIAWVKNLDEELASDQVHDREDGAKVASLPHVLIIVEGARDRQFIKFLIATLQIQCVFAVTVESGKRAAEEMWASQALLLDSVFDRVILVVDADAVDSEALQREQQRLNARLKTVKDERLAFVLAEPELEAWILAGLKNAEDLGADEERRMNHLRKMSRVLWEELLRNDYDLAQARRNCEGLNRLCYLLLSLNTAPSSP